MKTPGSGLHPPRIAWPRLWSVQGSFEPHGQQWLGWVVALIPTRPGSSREPASWIRDEPEVLNTNPYLFGMLVGAKLRVEEEHGAAVASQLTSALQSTLGAIGDRLVWSGVRPAVAALAALAGLVMGIGGILAFWSLFMLGQAWLRIWALEWGYEQGLKIGDALPMLSLQTIANRARRVGALAVGALALSVSWQAFAGTQLPAAGLVLAVVSSASVFAWRRFDPLLLLPAMALAVWLVLRVGSWFGEGHLIWL